MMKIDNKESYTYGNIKYSLFLSQACLIKQKNNYNFCCCTSKPIILF